ncbi:MAG: hypothetical protein HY813_02560 [Candidatus Portnoybacteria bacterium]|nr:hypothetical protein [Candidatus Portnoybacteria bacterium]
MVPKPYFVILNEVKNLLRMQEIKLLFSNKLRDSSGFTLRMTVLKPSQLRFNHPPPSIEGGGSTRGCR